MTPLEQQMLDELGVTQVLTNVLADYLTQKGVAATSEEGLDTLVPKVLLITSGGGGGGSSTTPLYLTSIPSDVAGFLKIQAVPQPTSVSTDFVVTNAAEVLVGKYLFDSQIATTVIDAGNWVSAVRYKINNTQGITRFRVVPILYHLNGTETELFSAYSDDLNQTTITNIIKEIPQGAFTCLATDRLGFKIYLSTDAASSRTVTVEKGDGYPTYFAVPLRTRHIDLREPNQDPNVQHLTAAQIADFGNKAYKTEIIAAPTNGTTLTLKTGVITVISTVLTNANSFTIAMPATPINGYINECGLKFKIGASLPTMNLPTIAYWRTPQYVPYINTSRVIILERETYDGTTWEVYATCDKN